MLWWGFFVILVIVCGIGCLRVVVLVNNLWVGN